MRYFSEELRDMTGRGFNGMTTVIFDPEPLLRRKRKSSPAPRKRADVLPGLPEGETPDWVSFKGFGLKPDSKNTEKMIVTLSHLWADPDFWILV